MSLNCKIILRERKNYEKMKQYPIYYFVLGWLQLHFSKLWFNKVSSWLKIQIISVNTINIKFYDDFTESPSENIF